MGQSFLILLCLCDQVVNPATFPFKRGEQRRRFPRARGLVHHIGLTGKQFFIFFHFVLGK